MRPTHHLRIRRARPTPYRLRPEGEGQEGKGYTLPPTIPPAPPQLRPGGGVGVRETRGAESWLGVPFLRNPYIYIPEIP